MPNRGLGETAPRKMGKMENGDVGSKTTWLVGETSVAQTNVFHPISHLPITLFPYRPTYLFSDLTMDSGHVEKLQISDCGLRNKNLDLKSSIIHVTKHLRSFDVFLA